MRVGIMQPYAFPYIGYFQLIDCVDEWVFFDVVQYNKKSWMNRNRILHPDVEKETQYISIPIKKHQRGTLIKDVLINNENDWKSDILGKLTVYKQFKANNYNFVVDFIHDIFDKTGDNFLEFSIRSTESICELLNINMQYRVASSLEFDRDMINGPGDWALSIAKHLDAESYVNPYSGYELFDEAKYSDNGIELRFLKSNLSSYNQSLREGFVPALSIIDIMMFREINDIRNMIKNDYRLYEKQQLYAV